MTTRRWALGNGRLLVAGIVAIACAGAFFAGELAAAAASGEDAEREAVRKLYERQRARARAKRAMELKVVGRGTRPVRVRPSDDKVFLSMGKVTNGRVAKADFKGADAYYKILDYRGRGHITLDDVKRVRSLGRNPSPWRKAIRAFERLDTNHDWRLSPQETAGIPQKKRGAFSFNAIDKDRDRVITVDELAQWIAARKEVRRRARTSR